MGSKLWDITAGIVTALAAIGQTQLTSVLDAACAIGSDRDRHHHHANDGQEKNTLIVSRRRRALAFIGREAVAARTGDQMLERARQKDAYRKRQHIRRERALTQADEDAIGKTSHILQRAVLAPGLHASGDLIFQIDARGRAGVLELAFESGVFQIPVTRILAPR